MFDTRGCNISQGHRSAWVKGTAARAMEKKGAMKWGQKGVTVTVPGQAVYTWSGGRRELQPFLVSATWGSGVTTENRKSHSKLY